MPFNQDRFATVGSQAANTATVYSYATNDTLDTVTAADYFDDKKLQLQAGDSIFINSASGQSIISYLGVGLESTVIASGSLITDSVILVKEAADLSGTLDSTKVYQLDGVIDMGSQSIEVPAAGLTIRGFGFDISKLISSADNYSMITSPVGGSGTIFFSEMSFEVTGSSSQVLDITDATGFNAIEFERVNFNNCTSLGEIDSYRQALELNTGRFGGSPSLTLSGSWVGGYRISTSITRSLDDTWAGSLFEAGTALVFNNRFLVGMNVDLGTLSSLCDFSDSNFANPSTLQFFDCIVSRDGSFNAKDTNIIPNISASNLVCAWNGNQGMENTFEGGRNTLSTEAVTTITSSGTFFDIAGTFTATDLSHFDQPATNQLRNLAENPREFTFVAELVIDGGSNDFLDIKIVRFNSADSGFEDVFTVRRQVNNLAGGRDIAFVPINKLIVLDQNDYVKLQVANATDTTNITLETGSYFELTRR